MKLVPNSVSRRLARQILASKRNSPHIFFAAGVAGVVASGVLACRSTLKLEETVDEINDEIEKAKQSVIDRNLEPGAHERAHSNAIILAYSKGGVKIGRLYAPSIVLGGLSIASLTGAHVQLARRNAALASTLALVTKAWDDYRVRVQDEIGEERELDLYRGIREETHKIDGKNEKIKVQSGTGGYSPYAKEFDASSFYWRNNAESNLFFLKCQQNWANDRLNAYGYVFLNDVYESLGLEKTTAGQIVGWVRNGDGDGYVDFGLYETHTLAFLSGHEPSLILDFNVDGPVYHLIDQI